MVQSKEIKSERGQSTRKPIISPKTQLKKGRSASSWFCLYESSHRESELKKHKVQRFRVVNESSHKMKKKSLILVSLTPYNNQFTGLLTYVSAAECELRLKVQDIHQM